MKLDERVALVSGAAGGIGQATARAMLQAGASVMLIGRHQDSLDKAQAELAQDAPKERIATCVCDVAKEEQVVAAVDATIKRFGHWDIAVNNAGLMEFKKLEEQTMDDWRGVLDVDLLGAFFVTKQAFLKMPRGGAIVNVASVHALATEPLVAPYAAAKAALLSLTRSTSIEGKDKGIRANAVVPGAVDTPMLWDNPNVKSGAEVVDKKDVGQPADIAAAIVFLASGEAKFVDGTALEVDGGRLARL